MSALAPHALYLWSGSQIGRSASAITTGRHEFASIVRVSQKKPASPRPPEVMYRVRRFSQDFDSCRSELNFGFRKHSVAITGSLYMSVCSTVGEHNGSICDA